ncbi:hypothetical protein [Clostridium lacusfryxellense]|uniref:hypothetical protein n=1 Tax=Clostridium lacusfryxellense TaxID=205328 RepID=UPI001C0B9C44|nr:hypothetical protein [Clostridium lacusfryxellense]MBU3110962.1 hypothetical protein [Clostridium lacusfryxellense]
MTLAKVTQENVHIFIPLKVAMVTELLSKNNNISWQAALIEVYNSRTYSVLEKEDTKLWYEGVSYLYMGIESEKNGEKFDI